MNLTDEELKLLDSAQTYKEHRAACDQVKAARGGQYPPDWAEKMLDTGKNDEIARRYGNGGFTVKNYSSTKAFLSDLYRRQDEPTDDEILEALTRP